VVNPTFCRFIDKSYSLWNNKKIPLRGCISMGYIQEYRNGYYIKSMIENAMLAGSFDMIGVIAGPSSMRVLNNKSYSSST
jgi:Zn ribbon nucleic-acid-binding protein